MDELYEFQHVVKTYGEGERKLVILNDVSITVHRGEQLAIVGASGSGKSTLLHLMGALDTPTSGKVIFDGQDLFSLTPDEQARFRNRTCGYVFQFHHLLPEFTAEENVAMPGIIAGQSRDDCLSRAREMLGMVGLADKHEARVNTLSGGETARMCLARLLMRDYDLLILDEPTAAMDMQSILLTEQILSETAEKGSTILLITHSVQQASRIADEVLFLKEGQLAEHGPAPQLLHDPKKPETAAFLDFFAKVE